MKKSSQDYKPPYIAIRYIENVVEAVRESKEVSANIVTQTNKGNQVQGGVPNSLGEVANSAVVKEADKNNGTRDLTTMQNWTIDDAKVSFAQKGFPKPAEGWARVRPSPQGPSLLPAGDTRAHIRLNNEVLQARRDAGINDTSDNAIGVEYVYIANCANPSQGNPGPCSIGSTVKNYKTNRVEKFRKQDSTTIYTDANPSGITEKGDDKYRIAILDQSALSIPDYLVWVKYWPLLETKPAAGKVQMVVPPATGGNITTTMKNTVLRVKPKYKVYYNMDLYQVQNFKKGGKAFGFGIERFDNFGDSRKSVQQTRGTYDENGSTDNFYVDTWGKAPEQITIVGAIELPFANDDEKTKVSQKSMTADFKSIGSTGWSDYKSFITTMDNFFGWNNNPIRISRGDKLQLVDYYKSADPNNKENSQVYDVSFKSRRYTQSVEKQSVILFEYTFIVLGRSQS